MKKVFSIVLITLLYSSSISSATKSENISDIQITKSLTSMPLSFTENQGQWDEKVKFRANANGAIMWFASDGTFYQFTRTIESETNPVGQSSTILSMRDDYQPDSLETMMIKAKFVGANANPQMFGIDMIDYKCNYFIGNDQSKWTTDVPNFTAVMYEQIYDGIDLKYYGNGTHMEYDFIVEPGADFSQIKIQYEGAESIAVNDNGELVVTTMWGEVVEQRPVIYQVENNSRIPIDGSYILQEDNSFSFELSGYNHNLPLVIDPVISYSTYLGGSSDDIGWDIAVDALGDIYITGQTQSTDFPTFDPYTETYQGGSYDAFVTKLSGSDNSLIYSTYLGGRGGGAFSIGDYGSGITLDSAGFIYITGYTASSDFPTLNAYQSSNHSWAYRSDMFVTKLNNSGNSLIYSTYLGGYENDEGWSIEVNQLGEAYIAGRTSSTNFPISNSLQSSYNGGNWDTFVVKFSRLGDSLLFSTYLGGSDDDVLIGSNSIVLDTLGAVYIMGNTNSTDFPTHNPYQETNHGGYDVFVTKLNKSGDSLIYSTYLGGSGFDGFYSGMTLDSFGNVYLMGATKSTDFPTENPYEGTFQGYFDTFVSKLNSSGDSLVYSTYLGGSETDDGFCIEVDSLGCAYVIGRTSSTNFPTINPYQETNYGYDDIYITKLNSTGDDLIYSTYLGGNIDDRCLGSTIDASGTIYLTGYTNSTNFPTESPSQDTLVGSNDVFVMKFAPDIATDIEEFDIDYLPSDFRMSQNYPNPFNPTTTIEFNLPTKSNVTINIYNLLGQQVQKLINQEYPAGNYRVTWDGTSTNGVQVSTGIYLYRLIADNFVETKKMLLLK